MCIYINTEYWPEYSFNGKLHFLCSAITKCDKGLLQKTSNVLLQNVTVLLQNATVITKCVKFFTRCDSYYKMRRLLQNASVQQLIVLGDHFQNCFVD